MENLQKLNVLMFVVKAPSSENFFFIGATAPSGPGPPHYRGFTITFRHATLGRTHLDEGPARRRDLYLTTQHSQQTDIHVPGGMRTHNPSNRAAADPRLRPHGHWDRPENIQTCLSDDSKVENVKISLHLN